MEEYLKFYSAQHQTGALPKTHIVQRLPDHAVTSVPPEPLLQISKDCGQCYEVQRGFKNETGEFVPFGNLKKVIKSHVLQVRLATAQHVDPTVCIVELYVPDSTSTLMVEKLFKEFFYNYYFSRLVNLHNESMNVEQSLKYLE
jgi:hypothetical protein